MNPTTSHRFKHSVVFVFAFSAGLFLSFRFFVTGNDQGFPETVFRTHIVIFLSAFVFGLFSAFEFKPLSIQAVLAVGSVAGFVGAVFAAAFLGATVAEGVRTLYPEYWDWSRDWSDYAFKFVGLRGLAGACIGCIAALGYFFSHGRSRPAE